MNRFAAVLALALTGALAEGARPPQAANRFYPADAKLLARMLDRDFAGTAGEKAGGELVALVVPHAGIEYSGPTAAKAYALLRKGSFDTVVIVGTGHYKAVEGAAIYPGDYATPLFSVPYDAALAAELMKAAPLIKADASAHDKEHSIEVQLPFLKRRLGTFKLVAMTMNTQELAPARAVGRALARAARGKRVLLIASSDMSHYPKGKDADLVDPTTLEALRVLDPGYFWLTNRFLMNRGVPDLAVTWCGEGAVTAVLEAARLLGATRADVLGRVNSGDVVSERDYRHVVGYSATALVKAAPAPAGPLALTRPEQEDLLRLARESLQRYFSSGKAAALPLSSWPRLNLPAAVFVTLTRGGRLRGCVGSLSPQESLAEAVAHQAVNAASADARFKPVEAGELASLEIEISVLSPARPAAVGAVRPGDGVIVENGAHSGVFLPDVWTQIPRKAAFLAELCSQKAGLPRDCAQDPQTRLKTFQTLVINGQH